MEISEKEVLSYLGFRQHTPDENTLRFICAVESALQTEIRPKSIYGEFPLAFLSNREVKIGDKVFESEKKIVIYRILNGKRNYPTLMNRLKSEYNDEE